jgi:hypothetical protein
VRVPEEAGEGNATVTLSFEAWEKGKVKPATLEVAVAKATAAKKGE